MKRVFAFISVLALTFMLFGIASQPVAAADDLPETAPGKWVVDPTLAKDEIPLYVAGSIATTFPNHFDEAAAKGTAYEDKAHRVGDVYPWNETKLIMPRYDDNGNLVGTFSAYPLGSNVKTGAIAGQMIWKWVSDDKGSFKVDATFGWVSLSQVRHNISGVEVVTMTSKTRTGEADGAGSTVAHMVFDGEGKAVRGVLGATYYEKPGKDTPNRVTPEFGYKNGVLTKIVNGDTTGFDPIMVDGPEDDLTKPILNELGEPVLDENGNPIYEKIQVASDEVNLFYKRFLWQYFATKPANVNAVEYLTEGWRSDYWDYYDEATGIAYLFLEGDDGKYGTVNQAQADVHNATLGLVKGDAGFNEASKTTRHEFLYVRVPVNGTFYDLGYLERQQARDYNHFYTIFVQGLKYGRNANYQTVKKAYNFSAKPLELVQTVQNGVGYMPLPGQNVYEVLKGTSFKPSWVVNIAGMLGGYTDLNDIFSYKNLAEDKLEIEVDVNGKKTVFDFFAAIRYMSREEMMLDFLKDLYEYMLDRKANGIADVAGVDLSSLTNFIHGEGKTSGLAGTWDLIAPKYILWDNGETARPTAPNDSKPFFIMQTKYYAKWLPFFDAMHVAFNKHNSAQGLWGYSAYTPAAWVKHYVRNVTLTNGALDVVPENWIFTPHEYKYDKFDDMKTAFLTDFYAYCKTKDYVDGEAVSLTDFIHGVGNTEGFNGLWRNKLGFTAGDPTYGNYPIWGHYAARTVKGADNFAGQYYDKWMWLFDHFNDIYEVSGLGASFWGQSAWTPMTKFRDYFLGTLFTPEQVEKLTDEDRFVMPIYVEESGFVEKFPPAYRDLEIATNKSFLNNRFIVDIRVANTATGLSSSTQVVFVVTDSFTPLLEINRNNTFIPFGVTSMDLRSIAKAYDRNYDKFNKNIKGNEISQYIKFDYAPSFDPKQLVAGKHEVLVTIKSGDKTASERVYITVPDTMKPIVDSRDVYLPYGADFNPVDGILFAYDNLDGNLFNVAFKWYVVLEGDDINTNVPGEYTVKIAVYDKAGNFANTEFSVYVSEQPEVIDQEELVNEVVSEIEVILEDLVRPEAAIGGDCGSASATYFISAIAVLGIALLVFRKKQ